MSPRRVTAALGSIGAVIALVAACSNDHGREPYCDVRATHCYTVCDEYCDDFGCYPDCYDHCSEECTVFPASDAAIEAEASIDAATEGGKGVLCSACTTSDECTPGSLCVLSGGADAGAGRCGSPCQTAQDCPQGFACTPFASSKQCVATSPSSCP
jgi:hypothetical protein